MSDTTNLTIVFVKIDKYFVKELLHQQWKLKECNIINLLFVINPN